MPPNRLSLGLVDSYVVISGVFNLLTKLSIFHNICKYSSTKIPMTLKIHVPFMYFGHYRLSFRKIRKIL